MGEGVCDSCRSEVIVVDGELYRVSDMDYCPFAIDYNQEGYIIEAYKDEQNGRLKYPKGELPEWLFQGIAVVEDWLETQKDK